MNKYSVIIPTKNGGKYLISTIKSVLSNDYKNFELIISFNNTKDNSLKVVKKINDKRVKIFKTPQNFSMVKHYEWILSKAKGTWVLIIGDDDGISSNFFTQIDYYLNKVKNIKNINSISINHANYYWDGVQKVYGDTVVRYLDSKSYNIQNSKLNLLKVLFGFTSYSKLPGLYVAGVIKKDLIIKIKKKNKNRFFNEPNPDVFSSLLITFNTQKYLRIEKPLFWVGTSKKSNAYKLILKKNKNFNIRYNNFLNEAEKDNFYISNKIPKIFWHARLPSAFVWSAYLQINNNKILNSYLKKIIFMGIIGSDIYNQKKFSNHLEKNLVKKRFIDWIKRENINKELIIFISILFSFLKSSIKYLSNIFIRVIYFTLSYFKSKKYIYSKDRKKYKNIFLASKIKQSN